MRLSRHLLLAVPMCTFLILLAGSTTPASAFSFSLPRPRALNTSSSALSSNSEPAYASWPHPRDFAHNVSTSRDVGAPPLLSTGKNKNETTSANSACPAPAAPVAMPASGMAQMCPAKSVDNPMRPALTHKKFHPDAQDLHDQSQHAHDDTQTRPAAAASASAACPAYDESRFAKQPRAAERWWAAQKKKDRSANSGRLPAAGITSVRFPRAPRWISYVCCAPNQDDKEAHLPPARALKGNITVVNLSFFTLMGPSGQLARFFEMSVGERVRYINDLHAANVSVMMSTFGGDSAQAAVTLGYDPCALGRLHGSVAKEAGFDELDNDLEDFDASEAGVRQSHIVAEWIVRYVRAVREELKTGTYALSAAPVAPWFTTNETTYCPGGLYRQVEKQVGNDIDWYNLQFYNQGKGVFEDCESVLRKSNFRKFENSSVFQIAGSTGVALDKLVIGKPSSREEATEGYVSPGKLAQCVRQARESGWGAGVMSFEWPSADGAWFQTVRKGYYGDK